MAFLQSSKIVQFIEGLPEANILYKDLHDEIKPVAIL